MKARAKRHTSGWIPNTSQTFVSTAVTEDKYAKTSQKWFKNKCCLGFVFVLILVLLNQFIFGNSWPFLLASDNIISSPSRSYGTNRKPLKSKKNLLI